MGCFMTHSAADPIDLCLFALSGSKHQHLIYSTSKRQLNLDERFHGNEDQVFRIQDGSSTTTYLLFFYHINLSVCLFSSLF